MNIQLNTQGQLKHFLSVEGLPASILTEILDRASSFIGKEPKSIKKVPLLRGRTIMNLFFEASTRTRTTFELAAMRLSADVMNINITTSSAKKGESLFDMLKNLEAMGADMFVIRHAASGAGHFIAREVTPEVSIINGGDGRHAHPTQAMLDMYTIRHFKGDFSPLKVAIVGDILHSRVARSQIHALNILGAKEIRVIGPKTLIPPAIEKLNVKVFHDLQTGIQDADVIIMLRLQRERMESALIPSEKEYFQLYGLTEKKLQKANKNAIIMHPGPINRGVEIASEVADGNQSVILDQVHFGIAIRMAVLSMAMTGNLSSRQIEAIHG